MKETFSWKDVPILPGYIEPVPDRLLDCPDGVEAEKVPDHRFAAHPEYLHPNPEHGLDLGASLGKAVHAPVGPHHGKVVLDGV